MNERENQIIAPLSSHKDTTRRRLIHDVPEKIPTYAGEAVVLGAKALGRMAYPLKRYIRYIAEESYIDVDEKSMQYLRGVAERKKPVIVAANHRAVDKDIYPRAFYRWSMSVDSFLLRYLFERSGIPLQILAQYNRYTYHPELWRRIKARVGDKVREGLYSELGYLPVHTSYKSSERTGDLFGTPYATKPIRVDKNVQEAVQKGNSLGFFTFFADTDETFPDRLRPGALYYGAKLGLEVLPTIVLNAKHLDPRRTTPPDNVVLRIGEPMKIAPLPREKTIRREQMNAGLDDLRGRLFDLRRDAFAALGH